MNKDNKYKYLFLDGSKLVRPTYEVRREFAFNDFDNVFYRTGSESLDDIFKKFDVPSEYRKVVLKIKHSYFSNDVMFDFITNIFYNFIKDKNKNIYGYSEIRCLENAFSFKSTLDLSNYDDVVNFYYELDNSGVLDRYIEAVSYFYRIKKFNYNKQVKGEFFENLLCSYDDNLMNLDNISLNYIFNIFSSDAFINKIGHDKLEYFIDNSNDFMRVLFLMLRDKKMDVFTKKYCRKK